MSEVENDISASVSSSTERKGFKFLIIRFSSIGDIVLTTPVVRCLKKQLPDAEIHYLIKPKFRAVMEHNPYISKIHLLQDDWDAMIAELKEEKFDHIIDLH